MTMLDGICECCKRERDLVGVASSGIGPVSLAWCLECLTKGAEPLDLVEALGGLGLDEVLVFHNGEYKSFSEVSKE